MTRIEAIVRPSALDAVKEALDHTWVAGITLTEVKGAGASGRTEVVRGTAFDVDMQPKLKVEVVVPDPLVPRLVDALERALRSGRRGDGKVFVTPVLEVVRVRTGDRGEDAL